MGEKVRNWLVVCVQSNREKKTYERLTALGFEAFLPLQEEIHRWSDRSKKVQRVVVPGSAASFCESLYGIAWREYSCFNPGFSNGTFSFYARLFGAGS